MGILKAENNISYTANNACQIYIIKQETYLNQGKFKRDYASLLNNDDNKITKLVKSLTNSAVSTSDKGIKLVPLITFDAPSNPDLYKAIKIKDTADRPRFNGVTRVPDTLYFLSSLFQLRNCPLLDLDKLAFVFQMEGQSQGGLANVVSFSTNFSVNGQSSAEVVLNNKDFKYNFKYFSDKEKYPFHLKSYFDTNDIIIIRYQKKNIENNNLISSFKKPDIIDYWEDPYLDSETDPYTTIFTGYINDVNNSFSFSSGQQTVTLSCTGPSKKLTWTRFLSNKAAASKDSADAILPLSAFVNTQTNNENNKTSIGNSDVVTNTIVRTYSGVLNIPIVQKSYEDFTIAFDKANGIRTDKEIKDLTDKINSIKDNKQIQNYQKKLNDRKTELNKKAAEAKKLYNDTIFSMMKEFVDENSEKGTIQIKKHTFVDNTEFGKAPYIFVIKGTDQPAYKWAFNNWSSLFKSDFSTVYQFIKGISENLQFNFFDDPYGTIHFSIPDMTLLHLHNPKDPNRLNQIINYSETQNTENIANVQYCEAAWTYDLSLSMINTVAKDYLSIAKYGEKMMQPFSMIGITDPSALRYASRMRMAKYNRKALSNIRVTLNGEPNLKLDKYAYFSSLRKLFYIESYSHSYSAGGNFTTSLNGTYTRDILCLADMPKKSKKSALKVILENEKLLKSTTEPSFDKRLETASSVKEVISILNTLEFGNKETLPQTIYQFYIDNWYYPKNDEDLKFEVGAMYTEDSLRQCYLDGFFWALPFDVNPWAIATQIQENESKKKVQLTNTVKVKKETKNKTKNAIQTITNYIGDGKFSIKGASSGLDIIVDVKDMVTTVPSGSMTARGIGTFNLEPYTRIQDTQKLSVNMKEDKK